MKEGRQEGGKREEKKKKGLKEDKNEMMYESIKETRNGKKNQTRKERWKQGIERGKRGNIKKRRKQMLGCCENMNGVSRLCDMLLMCRKCSRQSYCELLRSA